MNNMKWNECADAFHQDGSLRDIYVLGTTEQDWDKFLSFLATSPYKTEYTCDGESAVLLDRAAVVFSDREHVHSLSIQVDGVSILCHFFVPEEIEFDVDPREVTSQQHLDAILKFISNVGGVLQRDVILTEENGPEHVWFRYSSHNGEMQYIKGS